MGARLRGNIASAPAAQCVFALMIELFLVPASKSLLAQLHLVTVGLFTFLLNLSVVGVALASALASLTDAGEENCEEKKGSSGSAATVDGQLGSLRQSLEFLCHGEVRSGSCDNRLVDC